jgi:hypothetical protein
LIPFDPEFSAGIDAVEFVVETFVSFVVAELCADSSDIIIMRPSHSSQ